MERPDHADLNFLVDELGVPTAFIDDLKDIDERPRVDQEGEWTLTILRIPMPEHDGNMPYTTVPLGVMTNSNAVVTLCFSETELIQGLHSLFAPQGPDGHTHDRLYIAHTV